VGLEARDDDCIEGRASRRDETERKGESMDTVDDSSPEGARKRKDDKEEARRREEEGTSVSPRVKEKGRRC